ncbi:MAG: phenylalanine--tRNA ligase subunit beta [bacterium]|nr:phenylalanine--tRNA ligase subunit beta [bacterium]
MVFSYNWLQSFFQKKLPQPEKLAESLTMRFAEVEEVKRIVGDFTLNIDIRPNRSSDCFSHLGIAREISAIQGIKYKMPEAKLVEDRRVKAKDLLSIEVKDKAACLRYTARVVTGIKVGSSPKWLKDRLISCGLRPINNVVDIANYVMLETGQPLHAFDLDKLQGRKIIARFARAGEKITTLDEQKFDLDPSILVIADSKNPVAIAGIKGGKLPEIAKSTKVIVLESANFYPQTVRKGSQKLNLKTDASLRFEHGIDPNLTEFAADRAAFLVQKIAGGKVAQGLLDVYPKKIGPKTIKLELDYIERLLSIKIPEKEVRSILENLGFKIKVVSRKVLSVEAPTRRLDVSIPEDLIEDIGRIYGYDKILPIFPMSSLIPPENNLKVFWENAAKDILKEAGFTEVYNYSFIGKKEAALFGYKERELIEVENPLSQEYRYLRASLIPNLLKNVEKNFRDFQQIKIFELGRIFKLASSEKRQLSGLIFGEEFQYLKGVADSLLEKLGVGGVWYDEYRATPEDSKHLVWHPKKCAEIKIGNKEIGFLGEVSSKIMESLGIKGKVVLFDIDFEKLSELVSEEHEYRPISKFPSAIRDIAVLVPKDIRIAQVLNKIYDTGKKLISDVDLFDIYEGEELPQGKKNLAFRIIYQAENRTLSSQEIDRIQGEIIKNLEKEPEWQVRK